MGGEGPLLKVQSLFSEGLRRRCWSSAGCVLFVATQQMFLPLSRLPFVPPCFLSFSFVLCVVVVVLFFFPLFFFSFFKQPGRCNRPPLCCNGFGDTSKLFCCGGGVVLFLFFCPLAGVRTRRLPIVYRRRRGSAARSDLASHTCFFFFHSISLCVADCVTV